MPSYKATFGASRASAQKYVSPWAILNYRCTQTRPSVSRSCKRWRTHGKPCTQACGGQPGTQCLCVLSTVGRIT